MRRLILTLLGIAAITAAAAFAAGAGPAAEEDKAGRYVVELDNAFGLIEGADVKVAGVRAGSIKALEIDPESYRALVEVDITKRGFGDLREDVFCETRPQSLIGEYFVDCLPGTSEKRLPPGSRIPVAQTGSTIPADLVNNIMRRPYRERFSILLGELGAALAARGEDLNETIRRANPALRETDKVLEQLAEQRAVIRELTTNADRVVTRLADNRRDVSRFVREARDTAAASADRYDGLRKQFQEFPGFLRELRPTMQLLGEAADRQRPALVNLSNSAPLLTEFLDDLGPFSEASRPATRTLASAARVGKGAMQASTPRIKELQQFAAPLDEVATNLAITLEHLDDRSFAVEKDPRSPGGQGYTGLEALLQYIFRQSQATNVFDGNSYLLKVSAFLDNLCAQYTNAEQAKDPARKRCRANLGPSQPGVDQADPTATKKPAKRRRKGKKDRDEQAPQAAPQVPGAEVPGAGGPAVPTAPDLPGPVQQLLDQMLNGARPGTPQLDPQNEPLLDFLLGA
jgi:virulence factor Mce-like protein